VIINVTTTPCFDTTRPRTSAGASLERGFVRAVGTSMRCAAPLDSSVDTTGLPWKGSSTGGDVDVAGYLPTPAQQATASGIRGWSPPV